MTDKTSAGKHRLPDGRERMKAHDVRHLCLCGICGGIADQRTSISYNKAFRYSHIPSARKEPDVFWHPACCYAEFGKKFVLDMPVSEQEKFRICDAPMDVIRELIEMIEQGD
ncbi:hypothetical protein [Bradyrhizobium sp. Ec3.3]|uniref:hypothetical protein n=1 Tax=Bradyrhizobium sp. Ec3.3 TaxID=189753 RepID=UPI00048084B3|nr:hypothetical protein [Bradyrhizobium sp. Ec3.3]